MYLPTQNTLLAAALLASTAFAAPVPATLPAHIKTRPFSYTHDTASTVHQEYEDIQKLANLDEIAGLASFYHSDKEGNVAEGKFSTLSGTLNDMLAPYVSEGEFDFSAERSKSKGTKVAPKIFHGPGPVVTKEGKFNVELEEDEDKSTKIAPSIFYGPGPFVAKEGKFNVKLEKNENEGTKTAPSIFYGPGPVVPKEGEVNTSLGDGES